MPWWGSGDVVARPAARAVWLKVAVARADHGGVPTDENSESTLDALGVLLSRFEDNGLGVPPVPVVFRDGLHETARWCFATSEISPGEMYAIDGLVAHALTGVPENVLAVCHSGHGVNSYAISYHLTYGRLSLSAQTLWGGAYDDPADTAPRVAAQMARCAALIDLYESHAAAGTLPPGRSRLVVVESDLGTNCCGWLTAPLLDTDPDGVDVWLTQHATSAPATDAAADLLRGTLSSWDD